MKHLPQAILDFDAALQLDPNYAWEGKSVQATLDAIFEESMEVIIVQTKEFNVQQSSIILTVVARFINMGRHLEHQLPTVTWKASLPTSARCVAPGVMKEYFHCCTP